MSVLETLGLPLIPEPQRIEARGCVCRFDSTTTLLLPESASAEERFAAEYLAACLGKDWGLQVRIGSDATNRRFVQFGRAPELPGEGYRLVISAAGALINGADAAGTYYGTQTLRQCLRRDALGLYAPRLEIRDWPDLRYRAVHYDTKHHQDRREFVEEMIRELAHHKINVLVWEWEDKLAYRRHPEVGAPGAFTLEEMQALTRFARQHHVQIVPLVQGLGHVSYLLKHPQHRPLREIPDSNWEFCPLNEGTYRLLFDLWDEAIEATPGSEFLHIGSDETYELGEGEACGCKALAGEIGKAGLTQRFIRRAVAHGEARGRKVLSWGGRWEPGSEHAPPKTMRFVDSGDAGYLRAAHEAGYPVWVYAPNPGINPLFLPHFPWVERSLWREKPVRTCPGLFRPTGETIAAAAREGSVEGSLTTSWDDSGLHILCWMPRFLCAAEFSWKAEGRDLDTWTRRFFGRYFGPEAHDLRELFGILQDGAQFWYDTFERRVWHWGDIGKIHLPDFPRGDLEYSGFWRRRYRDLLTRAREERQRLGHARAILDDNLARGVRHAYDLRVYRTCAELMRHNADLILMLGSLEEAVAAAHAEHYSDRRAALGHLRRAEELIAEHLADRARVYEEILTVWGETMQPKGVSLPGKPYLFARDRARHFANRASDMSYLILDEQKLDLEGYLERLTRYREEYERV